MKQTINKKEMELPKGDAQSLPKGWEVKELGDLCVIKGEYGINAPATDYSDNLPTYLRITDIDEDGNFISTNKKSVDDQTSDNFYLEKGDIVFARTGATVGKTYLYDENDGKLVFAGFLIRFRPNEDILSPYFLKFYSGTNAYWHWVQITSMRSGQPGINAKEYSKLKLPLPPLPEQKAIAQVLTTADKNIALTDRLIEQKEKQKKWLMQMLLTGTLRLRSASGEKFSGEWKEVELKNICKITKGEQLNKLELEEEGDYPSYSGGISPSGYTDKWNTEKDTIIISEGGNSCGYVNFIRTKFWSGGHCYTLLALKSNIELHFLFNALKFNEIKIMRLRVGSGLPNIQKKDIEKFKLTIPSLEEQTAIANILQTADKEIEILKAKAEQLRMQKMWLMQQLLTGKKRLNL